MQGADTPRSPRGLGGLAATGTAGGSHMGGTHRATRRVGGWEEVSGQGRPSLSRGAAASGAGSMRRGSLAPSLCQSPELKANAFLSHSAVDREGWDSGAFWIRRDNGFPGSSSDRGAVPPAAGVSEKRCQTQGSSRPSMSPPLLTEHREEGANQHADWPQLQLHIPEKKKN